MYLIIGSKGQLGCELRQRLGDNAYYADIDELDITSELSVMEVVEKLRPTALINCAAYTAVDKAESEESLAYDVNAKGPYHLSLASAQYSIPLIHVSTDYVFNGTAHRPITEDEPTAPQSAYGRTKLAGEELACSVEEATVAILRTAWLYSAFGNNFVKTMLRLGSERDSLNVICDQIGSPTHAGDLADALLVLIPLLKPKEKSIFHFSNEGVASWYDFAVAIMNLSKLSCEIHPIPTEQYPTPAQRPAYSVLDKSKLKARTGMQIPHWHASLKKCMNEMN